MDLRAALDDAKQALQRALDERDAIEAVIENRRIEVSGLELALARHGEQHPSITAGAAFVQERLHHDRDRLLWQSLSRTDAVERVLAESDEPLAPGQIAEWLEERGRKDAANDVSATLAYLKRIERALAVGRAQWTTPKRELRTG